MNPLRLAVNFLQYQPCCHSITGYLLLYVKFWAQAVDCDTQETRPDYFNGLLGFLWVLACVFFWVWVFLLLVGVGFGCLFFCYCFCFLGFFVRGFG